MSINLIPITEEGYDDLKKEIKYIKEIESPKATKAIASARLLGDLSENAEYHAAKEKQSRLLSRFKYLDNIFNKASIMTRSTQSDHVVFGSFVKVHNLETDTIVHYHIVGDYESDVKKNKISNKTPIAKALLGKKQDDIVIVELLERDIEIKILHISNKSMV